jgi:PAT family beta-lactamase induction signal transducer AmpG
MLNTYKLKMLPILLLGFACGLPLPLTASTLSAFLYEYGLDLSSIGLFGLVAVSYSLKPLWSPLIDNLPPPVLAYLGKRRGWLILIQTLLAIAILLLGQFDPKDQLFFIAVAAFSVGFLSATQDIIVDALRIESLSDEEQGLGIANYTLGYRIAMLTGSAGTLAIAELFSWNIAFTAMAALTLIGITATLFIKEPKHHKIKIKNTTQWLTHSFILPFTEFTNRHNWFLVLIFVVLYKLCDAYLGMMTTPFLIQIGFDKLEIAGIVKTFGLISTLLGIYLGAFYIKKYNIYKVLFYAGLSSAIANLVFVLQFYQGHNIQTLMLVISVDNFAGGISSAALLAYVSQLCNREFTATQYAMLSSLATIGRTTLSSSAGFLAEKIGWVDFFVFSAILCLPALFLIKFLYKKGASWNSHSENTKTLTNPQ